MALDCASDQFLIGALTVSVRAVEKIYADLARAAQGLESPHLCRVHRRTASSSRSRDRPRKPQARRVSAAASFCLLKPSVPILGKAHATQILRSARYGFGLAQ